ncbi:MAG: hypothetical protein RIT32_917 [Actinomycetota bacterium]
MVSERGLEPLPPIRGLAPQASASAVPPPGLSGKDNNWVWRHIQDLEEWNHVTA